MKYSDLIEGIRMGSRELSQPTKKNYTIGFEFEVAVSDGFDTDGLDNGGNSTSDDWDDAYQDFSDRWYNGESTFDFEEWFNNNLRYYRGGIIKFADDNGFEPRYGWVESADDYIKFLNNKEQKRFKNAQMEYTPEIIDEAQKWIKLVNDEKTREEIFSNRDKLIDFFMFTYGNIYKSKYMERDYLKTQIESVIATVTEEKLRASFEDSIKVLNLNFKSPYEYTSEDSEYQDFDPDDHIYMYDENGNVINVEDEVTDLDEFYKYFDADESDISDALSDEVNDAESEAMSQAFDDWWSNNGSSTSGGVKLNYVRREVKDNIGNWTVKEDGTAGVDAEFISPPINNLTKGIQVLNKAFDFIKNDPYIHTSEPTGLHVNIGTWKGEEVNSVDWLKFLIVYRAERVLEEFKRISNTYAPDKLEEIVRGLAKLDLTPLYKNIKDINRQVIAGSQKYSSVNLSKLYSVGIIELRAPGNRGYENKGEYLEREIRKIGRALDIASDPEAYKTEYAKKLYKLLATENAKLSGRSQNPQQNPADDFFKQISGGTSPDYKWLGASKVIISIIQNNSTFHNFNVNAANTKYTAAAHKQIMSDLKEFSRINDTDVKQLIERYLQKYDPDNQIRNTKFMKLVLKSL